MDDQCGLCLSCGVPFMPDLSRVEYFNRNGVLSIVFLQSEFVNNAEIRRMYSTPKFSSGVERAHMFHVSHHSTALDYMCNRHRDDEDVGLGFMLAGNVFPPAGTVITAAPSQPFLYYRSPASHNHKEPFGAVWTKPARAERLNMRRLLRHLRNSTQFNSCAPIGHNLDETYDACTGCNALMTQLADFRYILGYRNVATLNGNGCIITNQAITQFSVDTHNTTLNNAYGSWTYRNNPAVTQHPARDARDADAPHVAYYLHLCLPYQAPGRANYFNQIQSAPLRLECRKIYLEQCWLVLEIACLATLLEEGKVTAPGTSLSHGLHQHYGVLDIYVSFFIYRLISFRYGRRLRARGVNFVQWHQKFYCDAMNCSFLFSRAENHGIIGQKVYSTTAQNAVDLVQQISDRLVRGTENRLRPLIKHVVGILDVPHEITEYFVPVATLRQLVARSRQVRAFVTLFVALVMFIDTRDRSCRPTFNLHWASLGSTRFCTVSSGCARITPPSSPTN